MPFISSHRLTQSSLQLSTQPLDYKQMQSLTLSNAIPLKVLLLLLNPYLQLTPFAFSLSFSFLLLVFRVRAHLHVCVHTRMTKNVCKFFLKIYPKIYHKILPKIIQKFTPKSCQNFHQIYSKHYPKILPESPPYNPPKIHATLTRFESMIHAPNLCQNHAQSPCQN